MLTGVLPAIVIIASLLTLAVSIFLLWLYRRATLRGMRQQSIRTTTPNVAVAGSKQKPVKQSAELTIKNWGDNHLPPQSTETLGTRQKMSRSLCAVTKVYMLGGFVYALVFTLSWMVTATGGFSLGRFLWLLICFMWPTVIAVNLLFAIDRKESLMIVAGYFLAITMIAVFVLTRNPGVTPGQLIYFWLFINLPATLVFLSFLHHRIRSVGPLVLVFMLAGVAGAFLFIQIAGNNKTFLLFLSTAGNNFGLGATSVFLLIHLTGFVLLAVCGWALLRWLGARYQKKHFSDQSITLDALWMTFALVQSITLVFEGWAWIFTGLVGFMLYKAITTTGFSKIRRQAAKDTHHPMLLLLRVFALGRQSEKLFERFSKLWRHGGSICMIAGPDLVTTTVEPHEFLEFVSGKLSRQFVKDESDLNQRISKLDKKSDPDGRFRVTEFFCHDDTWRMSMLRLAMECDVILMDLRSFSRKNQGCLYELEQLLNRVDINHIIFLVDQTTDLAFLEDRFLTLWKAVDRDSPNLKTATPTIQLLHTRNQTRRSINSLLSMLLMKHAGSEATPAL